MNIKTPTIQIILFWAVMLLLWMPAFEIVELEWKLNEQYHFGYFVPLFTLYLIYQRWSDRPPVSKPLLSSGFLFASIVCVIPIHLVETANPDWRFIYAAAVLVSLVVTLQLVDQIGGRRWMLHFLPALLMVVFSLPWIMSVEKALTNYLMKIVSQVTVDIINLSGIYAVQRSHIIELPNGFVGIEEACSGMRSLQSSIMAGYLFGELLRLNVFKRILLIAFGVAGTFLLNICRTVGLTLVTHYQGTAGYDKWHDPIGNIAMVVGFGFIILVAWILKGKTESNSREEKTSPAGTLVFPKTGTSVTLLLIIAVSFPLDHIWYRQASTDEPRLVLSELPWDRLSPALERLEIHPLTRAMLKYSEGEQLVWTASDRRIWTCYYFSWDEGRISSHAGVHRPENCMTAAGLQMTARHPSFTYETQNQKIEFNHYTFTGYGRVSSVFFTVWQNDGKLNLSESWNDRIMDAVRRQRVKNRYSLQLIVENPVSAKDAKHQLLTILDEVGL